ncbi:MAG: hypothetical protein AAFY71_28200 [Bacteroidota bacterium]
MPKVALYFLFLLFTPSLFAQKIDSEFTPQIPVIRFEWQKAVFITDTASIFQVYRTYVDPSDQDYYAKIKGLINYEHAHKKKDTLIYRGAFIPLPREEAEDKDWYVSWLIYQLIDEQKIQIYDREGKQVFKLKKKKMGSRKKGQKVLIFTDVDTGKDLYQKMQYRQIFTPNF